MTTLRDQILAKVDIASKQLPVPEWDCTLTLKGLSAKERFAMVSQFAGDDGNVAYENLYPALIVACAHDEDGDKVFTEAGDVEALKEKNSVVIETIALECMKISGIATGKTDKQGDPVTPSDDEGKAS